MMTRVNRSVRESGRTTCVPSNTWRLLGAALVCGFFFVWYFSASITAFPLRSKAITIQQNAAAPETIEEGLVNSIPYYRCGNSRGRGSNESVKTILLLHGARYTKEEWLTSGILADLCQTNLVIALDLPVRAKYDQLVSAVQGLLSEREAQSRTTRIRLDALVTPSASGSIILNGADQPPCATRWIPVAALDVLSATPEQLAAVQHQYPKITALYGNLDLPGGKSAALLTEDRVELPGGHAVYLDAPVAFTATIRAAMAQDA